VLGLSPTMIDRPIVHALWIGGPLSALERLAVRSHVRHGHEYHLWTYEPIEVPAGAIVEDANTILDRSHIFSYEIGQGKGSVSAFSNVFRYRLLKERGGWWCDTDVVALRPFRFDAEYVFASQVNIDRATSTASCVIKVPAASALMAECEARAGAAERSRLEWGEIGPHLLGAMVHRFGLDEFVTPAATFCPTHWFEAEVDPPMRWWSLTDASYAVHLWHEMWRRNGVSKDGDYPGTLYEALKKRYTSAPETSDSGALQVPADALESATTILDWTDDQLEQRAEQNAYGGISPSLLSRDGNGFLTFTPRTEQDHVAIPFVPLRPTAFGHAVQLRIDHRGPQGTGGTAILQDHMYRTLATVDTSGRTHHDICFSSSVDAVRVIFPARRLEAVVLPQRLQIIDRTDSRDL
jgi:hypothetical protein